MFKLKLIKGLSYTGYGIKATAANPFVEVDKKEVSDALVASRYFSFIEGEPSANNDKSGDKPLEKMTEKELEAYAAENGIDLSGASKKADKLTVIQQALAESDNADDLFGDEE